MTYTPIRGSGITQQLDAMPFTALHRRLLMAVGAGLLVDGIDVYLTGGVSAALVRNGVVTLAQAGHIAVATGLGLGLGGLLCGFIADRVGRRRTMQMTLLLVICGSIGAALSSSLDQLLAWRLLTALGLGGETVLGYGLISEFAPPDRRGRWLALTGFFANLGMPLALLAGFLVLPHPDGWRWALAMPAVLAIGVFVLRLRLPESPRWLLERGRADDAAAILGQFVASRQLGHARAAPLVALACPADDSPRDDRSTPFRRLIAAAAINVAIMSAIFGFVSWLPTFFIAEGRDIASSTLFSAVLAMGAPAGTLIGLFFADRVERKWGVVASSIVAALLGVFYAFAKTDNAILIIGFLVVTTIYVFGTLGMVGYVPELFPTAYRMRAIGISATIGRIVVIFLPFLIVPLFTAAGQAGIVALVSSLLIIQAILVAFFGVKTRGRSLEAI